MPSKTLTVKNLYDKKHKTFTMDGIWGKVMGAPETNGAWLIWGAEKNGKTRLALMLADYLSNTESVLYVSAEEGTGPNFAKACRMSGIAPGKRGLNFTEREPLDDIRERLNKRKSARVIFIDNITVYAHELKGGGLLQLLNDFPNCLFIFLAHEDRNEPYTATAKLCRRLAKVIMHVEGLACEVSGRVPGGRIVIDEHKAPLYHGEQHLTT